MRRTVLSTFLFVAILGLGCMGVAVPGQAEELEHPIVLQPKCQEHFEKFLEWSEYYKTFAYVSGDRGYACVFRQGTEEAVEACNSLRRGECKVYAKSPVNGKVAIVWKEEPKQVVKTEAKMADAQQPADELKQKHWAGYKTKITDGGWDLTIRYSASGENYFAVVDSPQGTEGSCEGAVDEVGNLEQVDCTPSNYWGRELSGNVLQIVLLNTSGSRAVQR